MATWATKPILSQALALIIGYDTLIMSPIRNKQSNTAPISIGKFVNKVNEIAILASVHSTINKISIYILFTTMPSQYLKNTDFLSDLENHLRSLLKKPDLYMCYIYL